MGVGAVAVAGPVVATHQLWWPSEINQEFLDKLRDQIVGNVSFEGTKTVLPENATKKDIKFTGSLPDKVELDYGIIKDSANNTEGSLKVWFTLTHIIKSTSGEVIVKGFKTNSDVIADKENHERANELANNATFSPTNPNDRVDNITNENINDSIIWNEKPNDDNISIEYSNVSSNIAEGTILLDYVVVVNGSPSDKKTNVKVGKWNSSEDTIKSKLDKIIDSGVIKFDYPNKESLLASEAAKDYLKISSSGIPNDVEILFSGNTAEGNDNDSKLTFRYKLNSNNIISKEGIGEIVGFKSLDDALQQELNELAKKSNI